MEAMSGKTTQYNMTGEPALRIVWQHKAAHAMGETPVLRQLAHSARAYSLVQRHAIDSRCGPGAMQRCLT